MPDFTTDAILLRKIEYGDHDFIISFLTKSKGKISVIAKNAKKVLNGFQVLWIFFPSIIFNVLFLRKRKMA
ncbi:recombination protein O N-terminal domain-containing protein [Desulfobacula sp.]|uniref:DNA repair protein RecO n=1 Tax=Desulfobacula sp. TaxID=2593537 RepID=UPI0025BC8B59|nr:recombination protein O N-terminal domain-containing protein [Desulfobacula sp.]